MAFNNSDLQAVGAAGGVSPRVFVYPTADLLSVVTTEGYFKEAVAIFKPNDIIFCNYDTASSNTCQTIICVESTPVDGGNHIVDFSTTATFTGDVRATDPGMEGSAYWEGLSKAIDGANGVGNIFTYRHNSRPLANLNASAYFSRHGNSLTVGDLIHCVMQDGYQLSRVTKSEYAEGQVSYGEWDVDIVPIVFA